MSEAKQKRKISKQGPFFIKFNGLHACVCTPHARHYLKSMLVSHAFKDQSFDKPMFDCLDEQERDFMRYCLNKCKIESRGFDSAYNAILDKYIRRLKMLQGAIQIGDDSESIAPEINSILDILYQKGVFNQAYYAQLKRSLRRPAS
ncbi:hypothetical protein JG687_00015337 [Phytophthora cactorum]|uniref:Uncharacterized protein n=1 Tax=Phytophthora cactorum TaxID=29920 RepID=A0A8T1TV85_9STRA|nr:hypothetical protein GQ600_27045 [Phytophthora cactorum]KAG6948657.1 hypothetical protein JG687_00015337 [Phytophthora cactorum]